MEIGMGVAFLQIHFKLQKASDNFCDLKELYFTHNRKNLKKDHLKLSVRKNIEGKIMKK